MLYSYSKDHSKNKKRKDHPKNKKNKKFFYTYTARGLFKGRIYYLSGIL